MICGKWTCLVVVSELLCLLAVIAQPGFLSIDCGGRTNYIAENNIQWVTDVNYIDVGKTAYTGDATQQAYDSSLHSLRFFPNPLKKSCYQLPVIPNVPYLLRLWFAVGNYTGFQKSSTFAFSFSIETLGMLAVETIPIANLKMKTPFNYEKVLVSSGSVLYICLIRTSEDNDPFISAIELRTLLRGMYRHAIPGIMLSLESRYAASANSLIRYPQDEFDRLWSAMSAGENTTHVSSQKLISTNNTQDLPPPVVMQTALVSGGETLYSGFSETADATKSLLLLYFAEIEPLNITETRSFYVYVNNQLRSALTLVRNYSAIEKITFLNTNLLTMHIVRTPKSSRGPLINSLEHYKVVDTAPSTYSEDIEALKAIQRRFDIKSWISDPCYVSSWDGIGCDKSTSFRRISQMNLSGMNLTGSVPQTIGQLTSLVNLSLENNHLTGPLPNFSNLTMLERLHLQDNNLTGKVPDWLSGFKNLRELFIDNNNFTGVLPAQLLCKHSLKIRYSGNRYLYIRSNSKNNKLRLILGTTLITGSLVIVLVLAVGVVAHRKRSGRKESSRVEKESKDVVGQDNSMIIVPNTTKFRAFTLEEIMAATQNFSHKIGQGGFGSVFFGKLEQKRDIAVKVLSRLSKQGVQEFLNEVDLLSRVHHRNLVSLLGYHNESRELMLVYEHMSGGSLRDHLYGPKAEFSQLNWKTRLKIALDAANGLEYLHVDCTPKIIHRDIKTANILLDNNFHGKLADFGLSRRTIDGEVSHIITTVKGTLGYLDPEYFSTQTLTEKSDVYSFGVVLLEIISGRQPINTKLPGEQLNLIRWVTPYVEMDENSGKMVEIIDQRLRRNCEIKSIAAVAKLAIRCVQARQSSRPSASEVVAELKEAITIEEDKISEIDIEYGELGPSSACLSPDSSGPKEMDSVASISNASTNTFSRMVTSRHGYRQGGDQ